MLRSRLEQQLAEATFDGEDIDEEELRDVFGRARFLIRKLDSKGWLEKQRGDDFNEYITVPGYSSRLLELFHQLRDDSPMRGYSCVFGTYSTLKVASEGNSVYDKMACGPTWTTTPPIPGGVKTFPTILPVSFWTRRRAGTL